MATGTYMTTLPEKWSTGIHAPWPNTWTIGTNMTTLPNKWTIGTNMTTLPDKWPTGIHDPWPDKWPTGIHDPWPD